MELDTKPPAYLKFTQILLGLIAFFYILHIGQNILAPLVFATILAIVLNPLVNYFGRHGMNRVVAIVLALFAALVIIAGLIYFLSFQVAHFTDSFPQVRLRSKSLIDGSIHWAAQYFNVKEPSIREWLANAKAKSLQNGSVLVGSTLTTIGGLSLSCSCCRSTSS